MDAGGGRMSLPAAQTLVVLALTLIVFVIRVRTGHPPRWLRRVNQRKDLHASRRRRPLMPAAAPLVGIILVGLLPWLVYLAIRPALGSDTSALAVATAVPVVWVIIQWTRMRRVDGLGLVVVGAYVCALALSAVLGHGAMSLKLRDAGVLGAVGLACLVSVVFRRPLPWLGLRYFRRHHGGPAKIATWIDDPKRRRDLAAATVLAGATFLLATFIEVVLMIGATTAMFLAVAGPLGGLTPPAAVAVMVVFLRHRSRHHRGHIG